MLPMGKTHYYLGLDVGGTAMKAGIISADGSLVHSLSEPTNKDAGPAAGLALMEQVINLCIKKSGIDPDSIKAFGTGVPGIIDLKHGIILDAVNLTDWKNVPVRSHLQKIFNKPVVFLNDANAAAMGEAWLGAGKGAESMAFITLGTGIGGGLVHQGKIIEGKHGLAGEIGHTRIEMSRPRPCSCGQFGCLEAYAGATSVLKRTYEALAEDFNKISDLHEPAEKKTLSCKDVFDAARNGDPIADRLVEETSSALAIGITNILHFFDPEKVVLGGGMIAAGDDFLKRIRWFVKDQSFKECAQGEDICFATLGNDAGILGAAIAARQMFISTS